MGLWEPSMCCCFNLRTGSIILGFLLMIGGFLSLCVGIQGLASLHEANIRVMCEDEDIEDCVEFHMNLELGTNITKVVIACFHIIFSSLLLYGIFKQKTSFFIPLMIAYAIQIGLLILVSVVVIGIFVFFEIPITGALVFAIIMGLLIFLETYFLLVIRAHYYEIKRAKGHIHVALKDQNVECSPYPDQHVPQYADQPVPQYPGPAPQYPGPGPQYPDQHAPPPYSTNEAPGYPVNDASMYPSLKKIPQ